VCGKSYDGRDRQFFGQACQLFFVSGDELRAFDQVEWEIAAQAQLGKYSQIGSALLGELREFQNPGGIPLEIAYCGVELCEGNFHGRVIGYGASASFAMSRREIGSLHFLKQKGLRVFAEAF
jgi:hypothetical protein